MKNPHLRKALGITLFIGTSALLLFVMFSWVIESSQHKTKVLDAHDFGWVTVVEKPKINNTTQHWEIRFCAGRNLTDTTSWKTAFVSIWGPRGGSGRTEDMQSLTLGDEIHITATTVVDGGGPLGTGHPITVFFATDFRLAKK